ncbi:MAG: hypothetical protein WKF77_29890 [Planctomycetaceae bacterium]
MSRSPLLLLAACLIAIPLVGCSTMESWRSANGKPIQSAKSKSMEQRTADCDADEDDEVEDEEYDDPRNSVGDESRAGLAIEEPLDPWFGKYNYADKGRAIERNLR